MEIPNTQQFTIGLEMQPLILFYDRRDFIIKIATVILWMKGI